MGHTEAELKSIILQQPQGVFVFVLLLVLMSMFKNDQTVQSPNRFSLNLKNLKKKQLYSLKIGIFSASKWSTV